MRGLLRLQGEISATAYAAAAPALVLAQHAAVASAYAFAGRRLSPDMEFWLLPLRTLARLPDLSPAAAAVAFLLALALAWILAVLSFRRAARSRQGYALAALSIIPAIQVAAVAMLAVTPVRTREAKIATASGRNVAALLRGLVAGIGLIVFGVAVSALIFGAYGWGLFVLTPFLVGVTTAYIGNRPAALADGQTIKLVLAAAGLGCLALLLLALEGLVCILMAAPLGAAAAAAGGAIGRAIALSGQGGRPLMSFAILPVAFAFEAAMPPSLAIETRETIDIAAPRDAVWRALLSEDEIGPAPGMIFRLGVAYPIRAKTVGDGDGAERIGQFSTGTTSERITEWAPGRRLGFVVESHPPAMTEFSPYEEVHAPHVDGYFQTEATRFELQSLAGGGTRLTVVAGHSLRLDPVLYWEPMARWVIRRNTIRVLRHLRDTAERDRAPQVARFGP